MRAVMTICKVTAVLALLLAAGCGAAVSRTPVPKEFALDAQPPGMARVRFWGDRFDPDLEREFVRIAREKPTPADPRSEEGPGLGALILSGGGDCGAYGAGLLCGWTDRGDRPRFRIVTGVSTGALIAPFAFLGPKYDDSLRLYTRVSAKDVMKKRPIRDWFKWDSIADSRPLMLRVKELANDAALRDVATEHAKGRRLYVQTVNLDAQRPVVWDMGAIATYAAAGDAGAADLFCKVLVASASIPGVFPPQYIRVETGGKTYDEIHVDGGTVSQMLMRTLPVDLAAFRKRQDEAGPLTHHPRVHVIRNGWVRPEWSYIAPPKLFPIAGRAISTMIKAQAETELELMYYAAKDAGIDFHVTYIPDGFIRLASEEFDQKEMNRMFDLGYDLAKTGEPWSSTPPRFAHLAPERAKRAQAATAPAATVMP